MLRAAAKACAYLLCIASAVLVRPAAGADWKPDRSVEIIVPTGPGSGVDNTARTVQSLLQSAKLIEVAAAITNRPGGSYGVALNYLGQFPGDAHRLMVQTSTPLSALITGQIKLNYFDLTPIANLITEPIGLLVRAESAIASGGDLGQRLKSDPGSVSIALAAARGNSFHIACALLARAAGADSRKLKIVVYGSSGDAMAALLGGHVDVLSATPGNFIPMVEAKKARFLGLASRQRLAGALASVPTFREQGLDVVFDVPRSVLGARGLSPEHVRYWESVFQRMVKTDGWRQALERNRWDEDFQGSAELGRSLKAQYDILKEVLSELGMASR